MNAADLVFGSVYRFLRFDWLPIDSPVLIYWLGHLKATFVSLGIIATLLIVYLLVRLRHLTEEEERDLQVKLLTPVVEQAKEEWDKILALAHSDNQSDWKVAIIRADIVLDDLIKRLGYEGENLGERLKQIETSDLETLNDAWEAHKLRNRLAHESEIRLDQDLTRRTIARYERVFRELGYL